MKPLRLAFASWLLASTAFAQSGPRWPYGYAPSAGQIEQQWERKADDVGVIDVRSPTIGAKCDGVTDDTLALVAALAKAAAAPNGAIVNFTGGRCLISSTISQRLGAGSSVMLRGGGGVSGIASANGSGIAITITSPTASFDAKDLSFFRSTEGVVGTGLSVTNISGGQGSNSHFDNLNFTGQDRGAAWKVGLLLVDPGAASISGMRSVQPDGNGSQVGFGLQITGTDTSHYAVDTKVSNSFFQGGHAGIEEDGAFQGLFVVNSEMIGNDYGVYAADATSGGNSDELVTVTNSHLNTVLAGIYLGYVNENQIIGNLFLHFNPQATYNAIWADHSAYTNVVGNTLNGTAVGSETFFRANNGSFFAVTGNNVVYLSGNCVEAGTAVAAIVVAGNSCQSVYTPGIVLPPGNAHSSGNIINGNGNGFTDAMLPRVGGVYSIGAGGFPYNTVFSQTLALMQAPNGTVTSFSADGAGGFAVGGSIKAGNSLQLGSIPVGTSLTAPTTAPPNSQSGALDLTADGHLYIYQGGAWVLVK